MHSDVVVIGPFMLRIDEGQAWFSFFPGASAKISAERGFGCGDLARLLAAQEESLRGRQLIVDLQNLPVLDSIQIGMLLALSKAARPYGRLGLTHISDGVSRLLRVTAIERLFDQVNEEACW